MKEAKYLFKDWWLQKIVKEFVIQRFRSILKTIKKKNKEEG